MQQDTENVFQASDSPSTNTTSYSAFLDHIESDSDSAEIPFIDDNYTDEECRWLSEYGWTTDEVLNIKPLSREEIKPTKALLKFRRNRGSLDRAAMLQQMTLALQSCPIVPYAK
ncbi:hypothetical protein BVRB_028070 [Beta vulgaris subsp. vulgaris]|uniref:Uncharacterized protein n=1 Tax=Beta vulgaris subsp. vulgaris TaxID=3555 RepID=A0A0J8B1M2_BETVV|nr:hypothetical protein BVRB_028070 [Beta vulgaris subsp. vulgaris]